MRVAAIEQAADAFLDGPAVVPLGAGRWTTPDMLRIESTLVRDALAHQDAGFGLVNVAAVVAACDAARELDAEQVHAVDRLTSSGDAVEVVVGVAGAGKTRTLAVATEAWRDSGYRVIATALAARTAHHLGDVIDAEALTLTRLLHRVDKHGCGWLAGSIVVVDEAAMVGTRQLARLLGHAHAGGAKVVLVGDAHQLPEIEAGGAFAALARRLDANELRRNRRQTDPSERVALSELRAGNAEASIAHLTRAGRITIADDADDARTRMVTDWLAARAEGRDVIMLARRTRDVTKLNVAARAALVERGEVRSDGIVAAGQRFAVGDRVMTRRNDRALDVVNGETATIVAIDAHAGTVVLRADDRSLKTLTTSYLADGNVTHAYAMTIHKAQGVTVDTALVLADDSLFREAGYTALSRGRTRNQLYLVGNELEEEQAERHAPERGTQDAMDAFAAALARSAAKRLAIDERRASQVDAPTAEAAEVGIDLGW
jgi:ATP-dependent exoDNAse (exonuclease V) alpha subunit